MNLICFHIESLYPIQTRIIVVDFSDGRDIYNRIKEELSTIPVGILGKYVTILMGILKFFRNKIL